MHSKLRLGKTAVIALTSVTVLLSGGCESTSNWLKGRRTADPEAISVTAPESNVYINDMYELAAGDPATQAEVYADAQAAAQLTPSPSTRLRYALVLATPGHPGANPSEAQSIFRDLLAQTELMTQGEVYLATIHLNEVESRIMLGAETNRLRSENSRTASTEQAAVAQRISTVDAENRRLKQELAEAEGKLEALSSIERSIRDQAENQ